MKNIISILTILFASITISIAQISYSNTSIDFQVEMEDGIVVLIWDTDREVNSSYFLVERANTSGKFEIISKLKAGSSTYQRTSYEFTDVSSQEDFYSYRVTLVYMDGTSISTLPESLEEMNVTDVGN